MHHLIVDKDVQASTEGTGDDPKSPVLVRSDEPFRFLDLPAELRNAVYRSCVDTDDSEHYHQTPSSRDWRMGRWTEYTSPVFNLTQVCTQIRQEFRPLCLASITKWVRLGSLDTYFDTFHTDSEMADSIVVDLSEMSRIHQRIINILPVFVLLSKHPNVSSAFKYIMRDGRDTSLKGLYPMLTQSVSRSNNDEWTAALSKLVSIVPTMTSNNVVVITVKKIYRRKTQIKKFEAQLRSDLGLYKNENWGVVVRYEQS